MIKMQEPEAYEISDYGGIVGCSFRCTADVVLRIAE